MSSSDNLSFTPEYAETAIAAHYSRKFYGKWADALVLRAPQIVYVLMATIAALGIGAVGDLLPGSQLLIGSLALGLAYFMARGPARRWRRTYFERRLALVVPRDEMTLTMGEDGLTLGSTLSSRWLHGRSISGAVIVPEGVYISYLGEGALIPNRAFEAEGSKRLWVELVNSKVAAAGRVLPEP